MRKDRNIRLGFIFIALVIMVLVLTVIAVTDISQVWSSWGIQDDETWIYPDYRYITLILFKLTLYVIPPVIIAIGYSITGKVKIRKHIYLTKLIKVLNIWFLVLIVIKLISDSVLELDRIFGLHLFSSINDIQMLVGYVLTFILGSKVNIKSGYFEDNNTDIKGRNRIFGEAHSQIWSESAITIVEVTSSTHGVKKDTAKGIIYYLLDDKNKIIYIGKAGDYSNTSLYSRIKANGDSSHNKKPWFSDVKKCKFKRFEKIDNDELLQLELILISSLNPIHNSATIQDENLVDLLKKISD